MMNATTAKRVGVATAICMVMLCFLVASPNLASAGPVAVGLCYSACNAAYVSCMAASGLTAGVAGPVGWWAWFTGAGAACSATQGVCMAACSALLAAPTP